MVSLLFTLGRLSSILVRHFAYLLSQWDPVQPLVQPGRPRTSYPRASNCLPIFGLLFTTVYGIVGLHLEATGTLPDWKSLSSSRYIFTHQIFPRSIWDQADLITLLDLLTTVGIYLTLLGVVPISQRFTIFLDEDNGKQLLIEGKGSHFWCWRGKFTVFSRVLILCFHK